MREKIGNDQDHEESASRRQFIKIAGLAGLAASVGSWVFPLSASAMHQHAPKVSAISPSLAAIQPAVIGGRNCWQMTVWKTLQQKSVQFGGTVQWGERAQWMESDGCGLTTQLRRLAVYVPSTTVIGTNWLLFAGLHSLNLPRGVWGAYVLEKPDALRFIITVRDSKGKWVESLRKDVAYKRDEWNDILFEQNLITGQQNLQIKVNGAVRVSYYGPLLMSDEAIYSGGLGPYFEYGPYNFQTMPGPTQTLFMQCGFLNLEDTPW